MQDQMLSRHVIVVPHDPQWRYAFAMAAVDVAGALGRSLREIQHIGSTAVPGIYAKPVIDMLVVIDDLWSVDTRSAEMEKLGYEVMGEFGIPGRRYFRRNDVAGRRTHQIHAFEKGSPHIQRHLAFRDYLRVHPAIAMQYSDLKRRLAEAHPNDIDAYMDGKNALIKETEAVAINWFARATNSTST